MDNYYGLLLGWLHIVGVVTWIGGAIFVTLVASPILKSQGIMQASKLNQAIMRRFAPVATASALIVGLSGVARMFHMGVEPSTSTVYGLALTLKIILFLIMIALGITISRLGKQLSSHNNTTDIGLIAKRIDTLAKVEILIGLVVLALATSLSTGL